VSVPVHVPLVALVGRPNVGKSTLFNRLCGGHHAIVEDEPGVTRDRRYGRADWDGRAFRVVDTGGLDLQLTKARGTEAKEREATWARGILKQAMVAVEEADLVVFVVDAQAGLVPQDYEAAEHLRKQGKPVIWVANKVDGPAQEAAAQEVYSLGADEVLAISAQHGRATAELCDAIIAHLPDAPTLESIEAELDPEAEAKLPIRLALVGRPNAGKSSLINRFLGEERMLVDAVAGTTRDPVDTEVEIAGRKYLLIDTAGIRRRAKVHVPMEKIAVAMAEKAVRRADVCVLVVDAAEGLAEQEAKIAGLVDAAGRALVICFNKLDLIDAKQEAKLRQDVDRQLQFVPWARVVFASASTGKGLQRILDSVQAAFAAYTKRVGTGELNRWFERIVTAHPPSLYRGHPVKLYFIQQPTSKPPTFIISVNHPDGIHFSYERYLTNQLRDAFDMSGTPIRVIARQRKGKSASERTGGGTGPRRNNRA
jgi:GTPase